MSDDTTSPEQHAEALSFLQQLASEVSEGKVELPCFSNVVVRISEALMDPATTSVRPFDWFVLAAWLITGAS